ncbi:MAG: hypothetical protein KC620_02075 [Myxococcales bacterium]|nr:hypothetical protein [Myxococcales bacterium]
MRATRPLRSATLCALLGAALAMSQGCDGSNGDKEPRHEPDDGAIGLDGDMTDGDAGDADPDGMTEPDADMRVDPHPEAGTDGPLPDMGGGLGEPCRADGTCDADLACHEDHCVLPGELDAPCRDAEPPCAPDLVCADDGICRLDAAECDAPCRYGESTCETEDRYHVCGGRLADGCPEWGLTVRCESGRRCAPSPGIFGCAADVADPVGTRPKVMLLVDKAGLGGVAWPAWREALLTWRDAVEPTVSVGFGLLSADVCEAGPHTLVPADRATAVAALDAPLEAAIERPLAAHLHPDVITADLGEPVESMAVVVLTTGDDTCAPSSDAVRHVRALLGRAIRTRILRVAAAGAPPDVTLDRLSAIGGLPGREPDRAPTVGSPADLDAALMRLLGDLDVRCLDADGDGRGPICAAGPDCAPHDALAWTNAREDCDDHDNDCDGLIDEGAGTDGPVDERPDADAIAGVCLGARKICAAGRWVEPNYAELEGYEDRREWSCDGLDNDCDGHVDEDLGLGPCWDGQGACRREGIQLCEGPDRMVCTAVAGQPSPEVCNGIDDDCDGVVDNGAEGMGVELCNGRDDDCDGRVDEDPDLARCPGVDGGETALACIGGGCLVACNRDRRDADGQPGNGCEAPAYEALGLGDRFTCILQPDSGQPECYGVATAPAPPGGDVRAIEAGGAHACVLLTEGAVSCDGPMADIRAGGRGTYQAISVGNRLACGLSQVGQIECWGPDAGAAFGREIQQMSAGGRHVCGVRNNGELVCGGLCGGGQACRGQGVVPPEPGGFVQVAAGLSHTCAVRAVDRSVVCFGAGLAACEGVQCQGEDWGQSAPPPGAFRQLAAGDFFTCGITADYLLRCWGKMEGWMRPPMQTHFTEVWAGSAHLCARRVDGHIRCFGTGVDGELSPLD